MCSLFLALAATIHLTFGEVDDLNYYHPNVGIECGSLIGGAFYNSEWNVSPYLGLRYDINENQRLELGFVGGYESDSILPFARYVNRYFFIAPGVVSKTTDYILNGIGLYESETRYYLSIIIGVELRKNISIF